MDRRKMERLRLKASDIVNEKGAVQAQLALCRRHFLAEEKDAASSSSSSAASSIPPRQRPPTRAAVDIRMMTLNLASASLPLFRITNRPSECLWTPTGDSQTDLRNFVRAIDEDLEMVNRLVDESVRSMALSTSSSSASSSSSPLDGGPSAHRDETWRRRFLELIEDMGSILSAIDVVAAAIDDARIKEVEASAAAPLLPKAAASAPSASSTSMRLLDRAWSYGFRRYQATNEGGSTSQRLPPSSQRLSPPQPLLRQPPPPSTQPLPPFAAAASRRPPRHADSQRAVAQQRQRGSAFAAPPAAASKPAPPEAPFPAHRYPQQRTNGEVRPGASSSSSVGYGKHRSPPLFACDVASSRLPPLHSPNYRPSLDNNNNNDDRFRHGDDVDSYGSGPAIPPLEIPIGRRLKLDVSFFSSPWVVSVFLPDNNARDYIADRMTRFYGQIEEEDDDDDDEDATTAGRTTDGAGREWTFSRFPPAGTTVAAYYYADKTWNRGVVMAILSPGETKHSNFLHQERALVLFLDYGNAEKCPLNHIRKLTNCFTVFNAQVTSCSLSGIGPVHNDLPKFFINTHQYIMADEFEDKLSGRVDIKHGRKFLELTAFEGDSSERSMRELLIENSMATELSDDLIVFRTAAPTPCPLRCKKYVTLDGECRHGFVLAPLEELGAFSRLKSKADSELDADFGFGSTKKATQLPWNSAEKLVELLRIETQMFYLPTNPKHVEERELYIQTYIADLKRIGAGIKSEADGGEDDCAVEKVGSGGSDDVREEGANQVRRRASKTRINEGSLRIDGNEESIVSARQRLASPPSSGYVSGPSGRNAIASSATSGRNAPMVSSGAISGRDVPMSSTAPSFHAKSSSVPALLPFDEEVPVASAASSAHGRSTNSSLANTTLTNSTPTNATLTDGRSTNTTLTHAMPTIVTPINDGRSTIPALLPFDEEVPVASPTSAHGRLTNSTLPHATPTNALLTNRGRSTNATPTHAMPTNASLTNPGRSTNATLTHATLTNASLTNHRRSTNDTPTHATPTNASLTNHRRSTNATPTHAMPTNALLTNHGRSTNATPTLATPTNTLLTNHGRSTNATPTIFVPLNPNEKNPFGR